MLPNGTPVGGDESVRELPEGFLARLRDFRREEDGSLVLLGLIFFITMFLVSGIALDLMRYEEQRTTIQNTMDRAALAAADLRQTIPAKDVVKDYFVKAGLSAPKDSDIVVQSGTFNEWRTVDIKASQTMQTWFMNMVGIKTMSTPAAATAEERVGQVEISLVLDVSGSMNQNNKLVNLKPAATAFIDQIFDTVEAGKVSVSIVPYSTQVSLGTDLISYFNTTGEHTDSSCIEFNAADFNSTALSPKPASKVYQLNGHFDPFYTTNAIDSNGLWNCPPNSTAYVSNGSGGNNNMNYNGNRFLMAYSGDKSALKAKINTLIAGGNTSIDLGMKWGAALLDPSMTPVVDGMIAAGKAPASFSERPYAYNNTEVLKVIVLMTDGENTTEYKLRPAYDQGGSTLWRNTSTNAALSGIKKYSYYDASRSSNKYYSFYTGAWRAAPFGQNASDFTSDSTDTAVQMSWQDVWKAMSVNYFADNIIYPLFGSSTRNSWRTSAYAPIATDYVTNGSMDYYTSYVCSAAKAQNVKIFTIGFETSAAGETLLKGCATSPAHYYSVAGLNIKTAFSSIANSINKLRLTH